jgi:hypothetical protein
VQVHLKDHYLQYAITWFVLAGAVVIAFGCGCAGSGGDEATLPGVWKRGKFGISNIPPLWQLCLHRLSPENSRHEQ